MISNTTIKATIATLTAAGLDATSTTVAGVAEVVVTDTGERQVVRDVDPWTALVQAAEAAGFEFEDG